MDSEIAVPFEMEKIGSATTVFMFDKLFDFADFISEAEQLVTVGNAKSILNDMARPSYIKDNIRSRGAQVYGTKDLSLITNDFTSYLFNNELSQFIQNLRNQTINTNIVDIDQKKKIQFTEQEIGIFSFDLASLGLIKVFGYFSHEENDFVDQNYVRSRRLSDGKLEFYFIGIPAVERHRLDVVATGLWSSVLKKIIPEDQAEKVQRGDVVNCYYESKGIPEHVVEQRQLMEDGKPKFATTWKKCFVHIPKVKSKIPRIDVIINSSFSWTVKGDTEMIWSCMAGIALAEKLQAAGVEFRVFISYPVELRNNKEVYTFVKVKDTNDPININAIAIAASDPRQFRFLAFKGFVTTAWKAGYDSYIPYSIGTPINDADKIRGAFISFLKKTKDFDQSGSQIIESSKIVFTQSLSEKAAVDKFNKTVELISKVEYNN